MVLFFLLYGYVVATLFVLLLQSLATPQEAFSLAVLWPLLLPHFIWSALSFHYDEWKRGR